MKAGRHRGGKAGKRGRSAPLTRKSPKPAKKRAKAERRPYTNFEEMEGLFDSSGERPVKTESTSGDGPLIQLDGLKGLMDTMAQVQKLFEMFQSVMPMLRQLGMFGSPKASTAAARTTRRGRRAKARIHASGRTASQC